MSDDNVVNHPNTALRKELNEAKEIIKDLERRLSLTEKALVVAFENTESLRKFVLTSISHPKQPK